MKITSRILPAAFGLVFTSATAFAEFELDGVGARVGFDAESNVDLVSYEAVLFVDTPWEWEISESVELDVELEFTAGAITGDGDTAAVLHAGFLFELEIEEFPISLVGSVGPTVITEDEFDDYDIGGGFQFTSSIGLDLELHESFSVGYRFQHISNAGLDDPNPGLDMHAFTAVFSF